MNGLLETGLILVLLTILVMLGSSRIIFCIRLLAVQGAALSILPLAIHTDEGIRAWVLAAIVFAIKGLLLPWLLLKARRQADVPREAEPLIGFETSILCGAAMLAASFWMASKLSLEHPPASPFIMPTSFFGLFAGLFLMISCRKAIMQVVGYLTLENGIYVFGVAFVTHQPLLLEMGVLLDLIVGVFVMGIAIFHISRTFDHTDAHRLNTLKDIPGKKDHA